MILVYLIAAASGYGIWRAGSKFKALEKYEFENRSSGGVVGFKTFEDSRKHERNKALALAALVTCALIFSICVVIILH